MGQARTVKTTRFEGVAKAKDPKQLAELLNKVALEGKQGVTLVVPPAVWVMAATPVSFDVEVPDDDPPPHAEHSSESVTKRFSLADNS